MKKWRPNSRSLPCLVVLATSGGLYSCSSSLQVSQSEHRSANTRSCINSGTCIADASGLVSYNAELFTSSGFLKNRSLIAANASSLVDDDQGPALTVAEEFIPFLLGAKIAQSASTCEPTTTPQNKMVSRVQLYELTEGSYRICIAYVSTGQVVTLLELPTFQVDTSVPSTEGKLTVENVTETDAQLRWTAARDMATPDAKLHYAVFLSEKAPLTTLALALSNGARQPALPAATLTQTLTGLNVGTKYFVAVVVTDEAGNQSLVGSAEILPVKVESIPPASNGPLMINAAPNFAFSSPVGTANIIAKDATFSLTFAISDPDSNATATLYQSHAADHCTDGTLTGWTTLVAGLTEATTSYAWNTLGRASGNYYVCAEVTDGVNSAVYVVSPGFLTVAAPATVVLTAPSTNVAVPQIGAYSVAFTAVAESASTVSLYYKNSNTNCDSGLTGWTQLATGLTANPVTSYSWTTDAVTAGTYYICAQINDGLNPASHAISAGAIKINSVPFVAITSPATTVVVPQSGSYSLNFTAADTDDDAIVSLFYKNTNTNCSAALTGWTQIITGLSENADTNYAWVTNAVAAGTYYVCARISDGVNPSTFAVSAGTLQINAVPSFAFTNPVGNDDVIAKNGSFSISFTASDADDDASISLYRSTAATSCTNGALTGWTSLTTGLAEDSVSNYTWDTTGRAPGNYYICAKIDDGTNAPAFVVSSGYLKINAPPTIALTSPLTAIAVPRVGTYSVTFTPADVDDNALVSLYSSTANTDCDASLIGWTAIATGLAENTVNTFGWVTSVVPVGTYYVCAKIVDGINPAVFAVSTGTVQINTAPTFAFLTPAADAYQAGSVNSVNFTFTAADPEENASISFYRKTSYSGGCSNGGTLLPGSFHEESDTNFTWDTTGLTSGSYYICARTDDGVNPVVDKHSPRLYFFKICTWTGTDSTAWESASNWNNCEGTFPNGAGKIIVSAGAVNQPYISTIVQFAGAAAGFGGGTITIGSGAELRASFTGVLFQSDLTLQGNTPDCTDCKFDYAASGGSMTTVLSGATLTLGEGLTFKANQASYFYVGTSTSEGHLQTAADSGVVAHYPTISGSGYAKGFIVTGVSGGAKSTIKFTGLNVETVATGPLVTFATDYDVLAMDSVFLSASYAAYGVVAVTDCASGAFSDANWTNWHLSQKMIRAGSGSFSSPLSCAGTGPVTISGSGTFFGPQSEYTYDAGNLFVWANGTSFNCTWTGAVDTDWFNAGNWSGCANGRGGYPDFNDAPVITNVPVNQPYVNTFLPLLKLNDGVSAGDGGIVTIGSAGTLSVDEVRGDITFVGSSPTCTTCILLGSERYLKIFGTTTTLYIKSGVTLQGGHVIVAGGSRLHVESVSVDINEWPLIEQQTSYNSGAKMYFNGVRFLKKGSGSPIYAAGSGGAVLERLDRAIFDIVGNVDAVTGPYIVMQSCNNWTFLDTNLTEIDFVDGVIGAGRNFSLSNCATTPAGTLHVTPRTGGTNHGYGAEYSTDTAGVISWQ